MNIQLYNALGDENSARRTFCVKLYLGVATATLAGALTFLKNAYDGKQELGDKMMIEIRRERAAATSDIYHSSMTLSMTNVRCLSLPGAAAHPSTD